LPPRHPSPSCLFFVAALELPLGEVLTADRHRPRLVSVLGKHWEIAALPRTACDRAWFYRSRDRHARRCIWTAPRANLVVYNDCRGWPWAGFNRRRHRRNRSVHRGYSRSSFCHWLALLSCRDRLDDRRRFRVRLPQHLDDRGVDGTAAHCSAMRLADAAIGRGGPRAKLTGRGVGFRLSNSRPRTHAPLAHPSGYESVQLHRPGGRGADQHPSLPRKSALMHTRGGESCLVADPVEGRPPKAPPTSAREAWLDSQPRPSNGEFPQASRRCSET